MTITSLTVVTPHIVENENINGAPVTLVWNRTYSTKWNDTYQGIMCDSDGNTFVCGYTSSSNSSLNAETTLIAKYDTNGDMKWNKKWSNYTYSGLFGMTNDSNKNFYLVGDATNNITSPEKPILLKYNSTGNLIFNSTWNNPKDNIFLGVALWNNTNIYAVGEYDQSSHSDALLVKYDINGNEIWNRTWDAGHSERFSDVAVDSSGNIYCVGARNKTTSPQFNVLFQKYLPNGTLVYTRDWGGVIKSDGAIAVTVDNTDSIFITGDTSSYGSGGEDFLTMKYNSTGDLQWYRTWGGMNNDIGNNIMVNGSDIYVTGMRWYDTTILKYDTDGNLMWNYTIETYKSYEIPHGIAMDSKGGIYICGEFGWGTGISDAFIMKFSENKIPEFATIIIPLTITIAIFIVITKRKRRDSEMPRPLSAPRKGFACEPSGRGASLSRYRQPGKPAPHDGLQRVSCGCRYSFEVSKKNKSIRNDILFKENSHTVNIGR